MRSKLSGIGAVVAAALLAGCTPSTVSAPNGNVILPGNRELVMRASMVATIVIDRSRGVRDTEAVGVRHLE